MLAGSDFRWLLDRLKPMRLRIVLGLLVSVRAIHLFLCSGSVMDWGHERCNGGIGAAATAEPCGSGAVGSRV
jgi:hypothetical protein